MKFFRQLKHEIRKATSSTYLKIALIAVILVPLFYGAIYLRAFWDPYAKIDQVPVAVVNLDKGYDNNGTTINIGKDLVANLKNNTSLKWVFTNEAKANDGLDHSKYYASITIPEDFSKKAYSIDGSNPTNATLIYKSREATNYLATTITSQAATRVADTLSHQIIKKYFDNIFVNLKNTGEGLVQAKDASSKLADGLSSASNGINSIQTGLSKVNIGEDQLTDGLNNLYLNQNKLTDSLSTIADSTNQLKSGAETISSGLDQTKTELTSISAGLVTIQSSVTSSQTGLTQVSSIINNYILNHPDSANELQLASDTMSKLNNGLLQVNGSMSQLNTGINSLSLGIGSLESGQAQLVSGLTTLNYGLEAAGSGSSDLAAGNAKLISGSTTLSSGISTLSSGTSTLSTGLSTAKNGMTQLKDSLTTGADKITASTESNKVAAETAVMASPVSVTNKSYDLVANYGSGFAPYFISLALWVGALLSFFVIDFDKKPMTKAITIARYIIIAIIGIAQAIILDLVLKNVLGLSVINQWQYYAFTILMSLTFMSILQLLIQQLANIGRYTAIILLILQLTSAAGTFPKETLPMFFQIINPLLPMTYSILGIRDILFTNDLSNLWSPVLYFVAMLFVSLLLNLFITKKKSTKSALEAL